jgi:hypothetical protein
MANLTDFEMVLVKETQDELATAKVALANIESNMRKMAQINLKAGRFGQSNAAMRLQGAAAKARGLIIQAHADASDALHQGWDDGGVVIEGGGGGR